ncbi:unnamed protein product [Pleuronectes platessa]|uniref:Uncharacterized protein n=1 Tax=Pleuronectes platessa TaxID=8262 RepID=A0A9N7YPA7_PLEPL|nr:unnamed protein product [Pleuronectes platessa]
MSKDQPSSPEAEEITPPTATDRHTDRPCSLATSTRLDHIYCTVLNEGKLVPRSPQASKASVSTSGLQRSIPLTPARASAKTRALCERCWTTDNSDMTWQL